MTIVQKMAGLVQKHAAEIYEAERYIWKHPETGYKEWNTCRYLSARFEALGYAVNLFGDIPGFYVDVDTGRPGPKVAILGELDSLVVSTHPECVPGTNAVHACGHNAQSATLLGVAAALKEHGALDGLCGSIRLMSTPAEELIELGFRESLREKGVIRYFGGKVELIRRGYFDDVDIAMMIHAGNLPDGRTLRFQKGMNGCILKNVAFKGVSSHAGGAPHNGRNALYAATMAMNAVNALRETFVDDQHIRFHPIITEGGTVVNAIPETVKMETYVRGASHESIAAYNNRINLAIAASAAAIGCNAEICDHPGYMPLNNDPNLIAVMREATEELFGAGSVEISDYWNTGSTDMGDVSSIIPSVHPYSGGAIGQAHGADFFIEEPERACLRSAQCLASTAGKLLANGAELANDVIVNAHPVFASREEYLKAIECFEMHRDAVRYREDGTVVLDCRE